MKRLIYLRLEEAINVCDILLEIAAVDILDAAIDISFLFIRVDSKMVPMNLDVSNYNLSPKCSGNEIV